MSSPDVQDIRSASLTRSRPSELPHAWLAPGIPRTVKDPALTSRGIGDFSLGSLSELAPELAETFVTVASDIALVVDLDGTIRPVNAQKLLE